MAGLAELIAKLGRFDPEPAQRRALTEAAQRLDAALHVELAETSVDEQPIEAIRAELRNSIAHRIEVDQVMIGSTSKAAKRRELGNRGSPPRPVLASVAGELGEPVARAIGAAIADAIRAALAGQSSG